MSFLLTKDVNAKKLDEALGEPTAEHQNVELYSPEVPEPELELHSCQCSQCRGMCTLQGGRPADPPGTNPTRSSSVSSKQASGESETTSNAFVAPSSAANQRSETEARQRILKPKL